MKSGLILALLEQAKANVYSFVQEGLTMEHMIEFQSAKKLEELYNVLLKLDDQINFGSPFEDGKNGLEIDDVAAMNEIMIEAKRLLEE